MLVAVTGMPRSGSTFSHNVVRMALSWCSGSLATVSSNDVRTALASNNADHLIVKTHSADDLTLNLIRCGAVQSVCTVRKPEDAVLSWMHVFGCSLDEALGAFAEWFKMFERIKDRSLVINLDEIERTPVKAAYRIGRHVAPNYSWVKALRTSRALSKDRVKKIADAVERKQVPVKDIGFTYYDPETFFHRRHISDRSRFDRQPEIADAVRERFGSRLDDHGELAGI